MPTFFSKHLRRRDRRRVDGIDRFGQHAVEFGLGLGVRQTLAEGAREAGDHSILLGQDVVGFVAAVATRQSHDPHALGVLDELLVEVDLGRQAQLDRMAWTATYMDSSPSV